MNATEETWKDRSYEYLLDDAVHTELMHGSHSELDKEAVRRRFEALIMTCSFAHRPEFGEFAEFFSRMCSPRTMHPQTVHYFLRAAWKACEDDSNGVRPIPGKSEIEDRARELRRALILDTEASWAYEGLEVKFRSDLKEGEDPAALAVSYGNPSRFSIAEIEKGMREHIENGGLEAYFARARAEPEEIRPRQLSEHGNT